MSQPQDLTGRLRNIRQPREQVQNLPRSLPVRPRAFDFFTATVCALCAATGIALVLGLFWLGRG